eukprot:scaffold66670_cov31-Attheya_sp.AAC.1
MVSHGSWTGNDLFVPVPRIVFLHKTPIDAEEGRQEEMQILRKTFAPPRQFDMVLALEMTSLYLSCGLCHSIRPQSKWKRA